MSVGLLIIAHDDVGHALINAVNSVMGCCPIRTEIISVPVLDDCSELEIQAQQVLENLDSGQGVLILTDIYGSTPSNIACKLKSNQSEIIAGANLPMLLRIMNYPTLNLAQLTDKAYNGGQEGIIHCKNMDSHHAA